jgi:hypothetical protein
MPRPVGRRAQEPLGLWRVHPTEERLVARRAEHDCGQCWDAAERVAHLPCLKVSDLPTRTKAGAQVGQRRFAPLGRGIGQDVEHIATGRPGGELEL